MDQTGGSLEVFGGVLLPHFLVFLLCVYAKGCRSITVDFVASIETSLAVVQ